MMATLWADPEDDAKNFPATSTVCEAKQTDGRDSESGLCGGVSSGGEEEELFSWPGPQKLRLLRTAQGFGFTLRHFIVYPPESALKEEDRGRRGRPRNRLEPMDTIFVKQVKEGGPAHGAGLCTGDRIVKVNGESIIGRTYSQVIALIQNSGAVLELSVMPKDEDVLQLAYSQDAYQKGHEAFSGNAHNIPSPPPVCYPRVDAKAAGMAQTADPPGRGGESGYRVEVPVAPQQGAGAMERVGVSGACPRTEEWRYGAAPVDSSALRSTRYAPPHPAPRPLDTAVFAVPGCPASARTSLAEPFPGSARTSLAEPFPGSARTSLAEPFPGSARTSLAEPFPGSARTSLAEPFPGSANHCPPPLSSSNPAPASRQNIDWRTYKTYREYVDSKRPAYGCRTIQERLDSLRAAEFNPPLYRRRSSSHERGGHHPAGPAPGHAPPRSVSHDRLGLGVRPGPAPCRDWHRPTAPGDPPKPRTHSCHFLPPPAERPRPPPASQPRPLHRAPPTVSHSNSFRAAPPPSAPGVANGAEQLLGPRADAPKKDQRPLAVTTVTANHLLSQQPRPESSAPEPVNQAGLAVRSASCPAPSSSNGPAPLKASGTAGAELPAVVVLREKPPSGRQGHAPQPLRHPSYILAVSESDAAGPAPLVESACWLPNDARRELRIRQQQHQPSPPTPDTLDKSLDSIPFIDEPSSPSADHDAAHIPASAVISVAAPITTIPPCPLIRRQLSHDQDSLRNAILVSQSPKAERSKSCDEGLDDYREERRARTSAKHLTSLRGLRKALDGHRASVDSGSRQDSSDIFSDSSKEGWLNFRQLSAGKSKRVGGGVRSWRQMYAVLRGSALYLYKDRREGLSHAAASPEQPDYEPQPISIQACLIDISYSDTKRRNVLRLTTSDGDFLFQAADREDMLSWIRVIQGNSNLGNEQSAGVTSQDLISRKIKEYNTMMNSPSSKEPSPKPPRQSLSLRHTLLGGRGDGRTPSPPSPRHQSERKPPLKDESSPPRERGPWKRIPGLRRRGLEKKPAPGVTFGVRLDDCPPAHSNRFVPLIVEICCSLVEERGLEYTGIYRVPGNNAAISSLQEQLDRGMTHIDVQEDKWRDLNVISSLLKSFFRKLPEPLFTNEKYADFIEANRTEDSVERLKALKTLLQELPSHHHETLKFLSAHLKTVSENCEKNKMEPRNLAIVFGPTLVRTSEDNMTHMVTHMPDQYRIVETLIQHYDWFFTEEGAVEPETSVPQESTVESQPVPNIDHLLTNIGRAGLASPGEVSDSPNSDSAKSKGSWGSGKEQYSRELLRSSIFAAASRKRKKHKEKSLPSSSDDDLDAVFSRKESQKRGPSPNPNQNQGQSQRLSRAESDRAKRSEISRGEGEDQEAGCPANVKQEAGPSPPEMEERGGETVAERGADTAPGPQPFSSPSPSLSYRGNVARQSSLSDPTSQGDDATSDLGTLNSSSSQASGPPQRRPAPPDPRGNEALAEVSSITSDYSTTSSLTFPFLAGAESSALCAEVRSVAESRGDDADDERSELVSEGRPAETDSESDFPVFPKTEPPAPAPDDPPHPKTHSESSAEGCQGDRESTPLARAGKGRSTGSLSSSSKSEESEKAEPAPWRQRITERFKLRLRGSADDMFGVGGGAGTPPRTRSPDARKRKGIRRRHTMGGQRDFAQLAAVVSDDGVRGAELSAVDRLKPKCSSQDFSIRDWIVRERVRSANADSAPSTAAMPAAPPTVAEQLNGDSPPGKSKGAPALSGDAHPHKLSGTQVVRSRFYQYL